MAVTRSTTAGSERYERDTEERSTSNMSTILGQTGAHDQAPPNDSPSSSAISELQAAFGSLLLARKEPKKAKLPEGPIYKWTGAFELFAFPRELRDRIYYYYLYRPKGFRYGRSTARTFPFDEYEGLVSLFLTCQQVYDEALQVSGRYNQFEMRGRNHWRRIDISRKTVEGMLRLFPEKPASFLQRVRIKYQGSCFMEAHHSWTSYEHLPGQVFVQVLRDGYAFKNTFPKLREFTIIWQARPPFFEVQEGLRFEHKSEDEKIHIWLEWMKRWVAQSNVVPPKWVRFEFTDYWGPTAMQEHAGAMNLAYAQLVKDTASFNDVQAELEESGRRWLEEMDSEERGKKGKRRF